MHGTAFVKQAALDVVDRRNDLVPGTFVVGKFGDECQNLRGIGTHGGANGEAHGAGFLELNEIGTVFVSI